MPPVKSAGTRKGAGRSTPKLPPVTVAKLEETGRLLERVVATNQSLFVQKGQDYREIHRAGSSRPLSPLEAAQVAAVLADDNAVQTAQEVQDGSLRAYDEPDSREILVAAGLGAAPAFLEAVREVVALVEMPSENFEAACENDTLELAVAERAKLLRLLELGEARERASAAFAHYAESAGFKPGEALSLPVQAVWQALRGAMSSLTDDSRLSQLIDSAESTAASPEATSSTSSNGGTP
jgi:hypothetical protein